MKRKNSTSCSTSRILSAIQKPQQQFMNIENTCIPKYQGSPHIKLNYWDYLIHFVLLFPHWNAVCLIYISCRHGYIVFWNWIQNRWDNSGRKHDILIIKFSYLLNISKKMLNRRWVIWHRTFYGNFW